MGVLSLFLKNKDRYALFPRSIIIDEFDKMQIPLIGNNGVLTPFFTLSWFGDYWSLRFCALTWVGALFIFN